MALGSKVRYGINKLTGKKEKKESAVEMTRKQMKQYDSAVARANVVKDQLRALNLRTNRLPAEVRNKKTDPTQKATDLELFRSKIVEQLENAPITRLDTQEIDVYLKYYADAFCEAVENGKEDMLKRSKAALKYCMDRIRVDIPATDERRKDAVLANRIQQCKSHEQLIELSKTIDICRQNQVESNRRAEKNKARFEELRDLLKESFNTEDGLRLQKELQEKSLHPTELSSEAMELAKELKQVARSEVAYRREQMESDKIERLIQEYETQQLYVLEQINESTSYDQELKMEVQQSIENLKRQTAERAKLIDDLSDMNDQAAKELKALQDDTHFTEEIAGSLKNWARLEAQEKQKQEQNAAAARELNEKKQKQAQSNRKMQAN